jgi:hypothetical protein
MRATTKKARWLQAALQEVADAAGMSTAGFNLSVSTRHEFPCCVYKTIMIPTCLADPDEDFGLIARTFLHELQHALDIKCGLMMTLTREEAERRARRAEHRYELWRKLKGLAA